MQAFVTPSPCAAPSTSRRGAEALPSERAADRAAAFERPKAVAQRRPSRASNISEATTVIEATSVSFSNDSGVSGDESTTSETSWFLSQPPYNSDDEEFVQMKELIKSDAAKQCVISDCIGSWSGGSKDKEEHYKRYHSHEAHRLPHRFMVRYFAHQAQVRARRNAASRARTERERQKVAHLEAEKQRLVREKAKKWEEIDARLVDNASAVEAVSRDMRTLSSSVNNISQKEAELRAENERLKKTVQLVRLQVAHLKVKSAQASASSGAAAIKQEPEEPEVFTLEECNMCDSVFNSIADLEKHFEDAHSDCFVAL